MISHKHDPVQVDTQFENNQGYLHISSGLVTSLILLLFVGGLCLWGSKTLMAPDTLPIKNVRIIGEFRHLSPEKLQNIVMDVVRDGFFSVDVEAIQKILIVNPWVNKVRVKRIWPDSLDVYVTEQMPVARWGSEGLINDKAEYFEPPKESIPEGLPMLLGPANTQSIVLNRYVEIQQVLLEKELTVIYLELDQRRAWEFRLQNGLRVMLGREEFSRRVNRFDRFVVTLVKQNINHNVIADMRYTNGFAVKWQEQPQTGIKYLGQTGHG